MSTAKVGIIQIVHKRVYQEQQRTLF